MAEISEAGVIERQDETMGVFAAALTPMNEDLSADHAEMARHCRWLLDNGCDGLAVLGTTGEANSFSLDERLAILDSLIDAGVPAAALIPGTGCCALPDTVRLTRHAIGHGTAGVLLLPPFYYKEVSDDGLFAYFAEAIERIGDERLRVYLYHFPLMSAVPFSHRLIGRLLSAYPGTVVGLKDSSGDLDHMTSLARDFPGFKVFAGTERHFLAMLKAGGAGCITAGANVLGSVIGKLYGLWRAKGDGEEIEGAQARVTELRLTLERFPMIPAMKHILAGHTDKPGWATVRPPLTRLDPGKAAELSTTIEEAGLTLP